MPVTPNCFTSHRCYAAPSEAKNSAVAAISEVSVLATDHLIMRGGTELCAMRPVMRARTCLFVSYDENKLILTG